MTRPDPVLHEAFRGTRLQLEFEEVERILHLWNIQSTVVVFGSSRLGAGHRWYEAARRFAAEIATRNGAANPLRRVIATGGGPGLMEAANRGAAEAGAPTIGFNIDLPAPQPANRFVTPELHFQFHYFAIRKFHLALRAAALVAFPGGFGTFDELFEVLTLQQTQKMTPARVILFDTEFWNRAVNFPALLEAGVVGPRDLDLLHFADTPEQACALLADA